MKIDLKTLIDNTTDVVSLPDVFVRINELVNDPRSSAADIGRVIEQDTGLTARLLKIVNSPYYGFPSNITTISRAITIIGTRDLRDLALATTTVGVLSNLKNSQFNMENFWRHNLFCAVAARMLAERRHEHHAERFFVAGLLHDIGSLIMYQTIPDLADQALRQARDTDQALQTAETELLGYSHADVGAALARKWNLPANLIEVIEYHHQPERAITHPIDAAVVHIANFIANLADPDSNRCQHVPQAEANAWSIAELSPGDLENIVPEVNARFNEAYRLLFPEDLAA